MAHKKIIITPTFFEAAGFPEAGFSAQICGVGMAECAAAAADIIVRERPDLLILAGIAGAYSGDLAVGETVVVASETVADLVPARFQKKYSAEIPVVLHADFRAVASNTVNAAGSELARGTDAAIENMEGAAFFAVCQRFSVPFFEVRTISNRVGEPVTAENLDAAAHALARDLGRILSTL